MPRNRRRHCGSPAAPRLEHDFGVRLRGEAGTACDQFGPDLPEVVQLAVVTEDERFLDQRLMAVLQIDDREPAVGEVDIDPLVGVRERALLVGTSVVEASTHLSWPRAYRQPAGRRPRCRTLVSVPPVLERRRCRDDPLPASRRPRCSEEPDAPMRAPARFASRPATPMVRRRGSSSINVNQQLRQLIDVVGRGVGRCVAS